MPTTLLAAALLACAAPDSTITLDGVTVTEARQHDLQTKSSQSSVLVGHDFLQTHFAGSLMQTLQALPGVQAMSIGSGQSKPAIRGLGFNRMAVTEDGIKHEGQQWGDDHGLEIDQFAVDRAEVVKGPAALLYGSDAIGGVLNLYTDPPVAPTEGSVRLFGRTNNEQAGLSARLGGRRGTFFYRAHLTLADYADYRVPADSIQYYSYYIRLKDGRLRNTAGQERDGSLLLGYAGYHLHSYLRVSDTYARSGFFANAHGLEVRLSDIDYDRSRRDIDLPFQSVNHLKVLSKTTWRSETLSAEGSLAYQRNLREERSEPVSHGYMPRPADDLERRFDKHTGTALLRLHWTPEGPHALSAGLSAEYQHNRRGGWGFIIPDFETLSLGAYAADTYTVSERLALNAGLRYDRARIRIHGYTDWYATPVGTDTQNRQRSAPLSRHFGSLTWSAGLVYTAAGWVLKANVGKSFRVPIAKELGADGINYHIFRYERGYSRLDPERSYQADAALHWTGRTLRVQVDPYVNYFPNYIYLNPTAEYVEGLQLYHYTQARVLRYGAEAQLTWTPTPRWEAGLQGEWLRARQLSGQKKGYTLPFSTPWRVQASARHRFGAGAASFVGAGVRLVGAQYDIVPPEKPTDGHWTLNAEAGRRVALRGATLTLTLHADNLLNRRYYDHTSYYRLIDVPEPGRNCALMVGVDF